LWLLVVVVVAQISLPLMLVAAVVALVDSELAQGYLLLLELTTQ
jgi:hypothetical protein